MPKEDYLLKYIEKLNRVIAAMLGFREKGFPEDAIRLAQEAYTELLDIDLDVLSAISNNEFNGVLTQHNYSHTHIEALAEILFQTANAYNELNINVKAESFYSKSLQTLLHLNTKDRTFSMEREERINELRELIKG